MIYDVPSQATIYRRLRELEDEVEKLQNEIKEMKKEQQWNT